MAKKVSINPRRTSKCYEPKLVSAKYPTRRDTSINQLKRKAKDAKSKAAAKPVKKPKPKIFPVVIKVINASDLKVLREVFGSQSSGLEMFNQGMMPGEYAGIIASLLAVSKYTDLQQEYKKRFRNARTKDMKAKVNTRWKQLNDSFKQYYISGGCASITEAQLVNMTKLVSKDRAAKKILDKIKMDSPLLNTKSNISKELRAKFNIADASYNNAAVPIDIAVSSIIDICDFDVTVTYTHPILINEPFELTMETWCPTWDDWFRTCEVLILGGRLRVLLNLVLDITISCFGVSVAGTAIADGCLGEFSTDIPTTVNPSAISICGQCWAVATTVTVFSKIRGSDGNCTFGLAIEGTTGCNLPLFPLAAGNFVLTTQINAPCGLSIG